jgi:hypothetical protein
VNVEKRHDVAITENIPVNVSQNAAVLSDHTNSDMTGNERIRNSGETAVTQVHVSSTNFGVNRVQQSGARLELGRRVFLGASDCADAGNRCRAVRFAYQIFTRSSGANHILSPALMSKLR